jgi:hypothetical protein
VAEDEFAMIMAADRVCYYQHHLFAITNLPSVRVNSITIRKPAYPPPKPEAMRAAVIGEVRVRPDLCPFDEFTADPIRQPFQKRHHSGPKV